MTDSRHDTVADRAPGQESASAADLFSRVATAPISWGICEVPGWGVQLPVDRVLDEMATLGFTHTELGSAGWLPEEARALSDTLAAHDLALLAAFIPLVLHRPEEADNARAQAAAALELLAAAGATHFNTAPVTSADWAPRRPLTDDEWSHTFDLLNELDETCSDAGIRQVVHEHVGCTIETRDEVEQLLAETHVALVLDTGHLAVGGYDPVELAAKYPERVGLVHLKDTRLSVAEELNRGEVTLMEAVQAGLFPALGQGDLPIAQVIETLEAGGYDGWYVIEQDCALTGPEPVPGAGPMGDVAASVAYLRNEVGAFRC